MLRTSIAIGSSLAAAQFVAAAGPAGAVRAWGFNQSGQTTVPTDIGSAVAVAGGDDFSLALRVNGTVRAWGLNGSGQCDVPAGLTGVVVIGAGSYHAAALKADQTVVCWGNNSSGQLDQPVGLAGVIALAVGSLHNVALKSDGTIACWGDNHTNQCDVPLDLGPATGVGAGLDHSVAIKANGDVRCWGYNAANQLNVPATLHNATKVAAGAMHTLALTASGGVVAWGDTSNGKCNVPASAVNVVAIAAGFEHSVALKASGAVVCWGQNLAIFGSPCTVPANVGTAVGIGAGGRHTMALSQVAPMPTVSLVSATPSNCDAGNGAIDVTVTNTTSVAWTGPNGFTASTVDLSGLAPGGYTVTAMGAGGTASLSVTVTAAPDTVVPVIASYTASASSAASASCTAVVPNFAASVQASDNCTPAAQLVVIQSPAAGALIGLGAHPVTITVQDGSDNSASVTASFTVTGAATTYYRDADGDTYGNSAVTATSCAGGAPAGFVASATDCNDANPAVHPGAAEACGDGLDNNCSGEIDEGCAPFTVSMAAPAGSPARPAVGVPYVVRVSCSSAAGSALTGEQLAVHFDAARLALVDVVRVAGSPFTLETAREIDGAAGTLRYAADVPSGSAGLAGAAELVDLVFSVRAGASLCGDAVLATFEPVGAAVTRFTRAAAAPLVPVAANLPSIPLDAMAPVLAGVPALDIDVAADAGSAVGAHVALPTVTALDACDGAVAVIATGVPADGVFAVGATTVTWRAVDAAGNATIVNRTVTVEPYQLLELAVCVDGAFAGNSTRQIRVTVGAASSVVSVPFTQTCGTVSAYHVPVSASLACVTAKDTAHSLSAHGAATIAGTRYSASVSLKQGDSNDDDVVDIVDFALLVDDFGGPRAANTRSNFDANAFVNNADFSYIAVHYLETGDPCVAGALNGAHPRDRVSVKQLRREGLGRLESADINRDGWVDAVDVQMFMQGRRSGGAPQRADIARESGSVVW